jgi:hypothetical protein
LTNIERFQDAARMETLFGVAKEDLESDKAPSKKEAPAFTHAKDEYERRPTGKEGRPKMSPATRDAIDSFDYLFGGQDDEWTKTQQAQGVGRYKKGTMNRGERTTSRRDRRGGSWDKSSCE